MASFDNVLFATEKMVIEWMLNPVSFTLTKSLASFKCAPTVSITNPCPAKI